jgi:hypothetical protein
VNQKRQLLVSTSIIALAALAFLDVSAKFAKADDLNPNDVMSDVTNVDVAVDLATFAIVPSAGNPPGKPLGSTPYRGTTFIVNGKIFPAGTLPSGAASNDPNRPGSIGDWICKGFLTADLSDQLSGASKVGFNTTQMFLFNGDGQAIWTEGLEGSLSQAGVQTNRIVLGGTGRFEGSSGTAVQESLGTNATGAPNIRIHFKIKG